MSSTTASLEAWTVQDHHNYDYKGVGDGDRRTVPFTTIVTIVAGTGASGDSGDGGPATQATLSYPEDIAIGPDGSLSIADTFNCRIRRVGPNGIITTVSATGEYGVITGTTVPLHKPIIF